jgi:hypothetical protein
LEHNKSSAAGAERQPGSQQVFPYAEPYLDKPRFFLAMTGLFGYPLKALGWLVTLRRKAVANADA